MDIQNYINMQSKVWAGERSATQLTLGEMILTLESLDPELVIKGLGDLHSYRGYYSDLAFDVGTAVDKPVIQLLEECREAIGSTYEGWKGGDFTMTKSTPLFVAYEGSCGLRLMGIVTGKIVTSEEPD